MSVQVLDERGFPVPVFKAGTVQVVTVGAASAAISTAFGAKTTVARIVSTTDCHYVLGAAPSADNQDSFLPANTIEYIGVEPGEKIAFIQNAAGGSAYVTEAL